MAKEAFQPGVEENNPQEQREALTLRDRSIVIIGGTSGIGLTLGIEAKKLGARDIFLGSSDMSGEKYGIALTRFKRLAKGDIEDVSPFFADMTNPAQVEDAVEGLKRNGVPVTDVVIAAAGGMREYGGEFQADIRAMNAILAQGDPDAQEKVDEGIEQLNRKLDIWLPQYEESALDINVRAPQHIVEAFAANFHDFSVLYTNSMFGKDGRSPRFYKNVGLKRLFSLWLGQHAAELASQGIDTGEFTAFVVADTDVGNLFINGIAPLCPPDVRDVIINTQVKKANVALAMLDFMRMPKADRAKEPRPYHRYIVGDGGQALVLKDLPPHLVIDPTRFPF